MPRLYGGEVTTTSTDSDGNAAMPRTQSPRCNSNTVGFMPEGKTPAGFAGRVVIGSVGNSSPASSGARACFISPSGAFPSWTPTRHPAAGGHGRVAGLVHPHRPNLPLPGLSRFRPGGRVL